MVERVSNNVILHCLDPDAILRNHMPEIKCAVKLLEFAISRQRHIEPTRSGMKDRGMEYRGKTKTRIIYER